MEKKWSLQDIKPSTPAKKRTTSIEPRPTAPREPLPETPKAEPRVRTSSYQSSTKKRPSFVLTGVIAVGILLFGFGVSALMESATVTVFPRHREPTVNSVFEAKREAAASEISYEIMSLEAEGERQVSATGQENVSVQATGEITIAKSTTGSERLIKNTRFASPEGLVFHITESVEVPGATKDADGNLVPGTVKAKVFADKAGPEYNLSAGTKFQVPGYKEGGYTELYNAVTASNNSAFSGGYDGPKFTVNDDELKAATNSLHEELSNALLARVDTEKPAGFIYFEPAITITYEDLSPVDAGSGQVTIKEKAVLEIPIFKDTDFASFIAKAVIPGYEGEPVRIDNIDGLNFAYTSTTTEGAKLSSLDSFGFKLVGNTQIIWTFDEDKLKSDLLGASKTALNTVLGGYPAIERANAVVRPVWKRSFPDKLKNITVTESLEDN